VIEKPALSWRNTASWMQE